MKINVLLSGLSIPLSLNVHYPYPPPHSPFPSGPLLISLIFGHTVNSVTWDQYWSKQPLLTHTIQTICRLPPPLQYHQCQFRALTNGTCWRTYWRTTTIWSVQWATTPTRSSLPSPSAWCRSWMWWVPVFTLDLSVCIWSRCQSAMECQACQYGFSYCAKNVFGHAIRIALYTIHNVYRRPEWWYI